MAISAAKLEIEVSAETSGAERDLKSVGKTVDNMARNLTRTGGVLTAAIGAPLIGIASAALDAAGEFEQSMNVLQQVTGASESAMASLSDQALTLGKDTVFSAGEAAEAMLELGKAGMDTEDIMASIGGVMSLAAAGGVGLSEAANLTASTLNAFNLEASEAVRIADLMAATANASAADITDLGQGMRQAGFAFSLANQPVENLAASLAILTNVGLTGSDAGTALKNAFMRMMNPTDEASKLMDQLNISFYDAQGQMKQLPDIIDMLNLATGHLTNQQRDAALATLFMSDGMKAMIPLLNQGSTGFNSMVGEVTQVGAASEVAEARMGGWRGAMEELRGSVDSFLIGAALPFLDSLSGIARGAADAVSWFGDLEQPVINSTLAFLGAVAGAGLLMLALGGLGAAVSLVSFPLLVLAIGLGLFAAAWTSNWGDIQGKTEDAIGVITPLIDSLTTQIGELSTAIGTAFSNTTFPTFDELMRDFKAGDFQKLATTIRTTTVDLLVNLDTELNLTGKATQLRGQLLGVINGVGEAIAALDIGENKVNMDSLRDKILGGLTTALDGISFGEGSTVFAGFVDKLAATVRGLDLSGIDWAGILQTALLGKIGLALKGIQWVIGSEDFAALRTSALDAIKTINWGDLGTAFAGLGSAVLGQLTLIGQDIIGDVGAAFSKNTGIKLSPDNLKFSLPIMPPIDVPAPPYNVLPSPPVTIPAPEFKIASAKPGIDLSAASQNWANSMTTLANTINNQDWSPFGRNIVQGISRALTADVSGLQNFANNFAASVRNTLGSIKWGELDKSFGSLAMAVRGGIYDVFSGMGKELSPIISGLNTDFSAKMSTLGTDIRLGIVSAFTGLDTEFSTAMTTMGATMRTSITTAYTGLDTLFSTNMETIGTDIRTGITTFFTGINTAFSSALTTLGADIRGYITSAFTGLFGGLSSAEGSTIGGNIGIGSGASPNLVEDESRIGGSKGKYSMRPSGAAEQAPLDWSQYVSPLLWETYVLPLDWATIVRTLDWGMYLVTLAWDNFVTQLAWANYIIRISWDAYIPRLNWGSYVSSLNWDGYIGDMSWGNYVDRLDWARFVPRLAASAVGGNATGTNYFGGGLSWVGERGPELVSLPRGSRIYSNRESEAIAAGGMTINVYVDRIANDMDLHTAASKLAREFKKRIS